MGDAHIVVERQIDRLAVKTGCLSLCRWQYCFVWCLFFSDASVKITHSVGLKSFFYGKRRSSGIMLLAAAAKEKVLDGTT